MAIDGRPRFARDFPRTPELDALVEAFARGDYAHIRAEAPKLVQSAGNDSVRSSAQMLVTRTDPDPLAVWLLVLASALLAVLSAYWIANGKAPP